MEEREEKEEVKEEEEEEKERARESRVVPVTRSLLVALGDVGPSLRFYRTNTELEETRVRRFSIRGRTRRSFPLRYAARCDSVNFRAGSHKTRKVDV